MMTNTQVPLPKEITRVGEHDVKIVWQDGHESVYLARELRLRCPCAGCLDPSTRPEGLAQDSAPQKSTGLREMTGRVRLIASSVPQDVRPLKIEQVGRYAINIRWSDGHHTGIYAFDYLRKLCPCCRSGEG